MVVQCEMKECPYHHDIENQCTIYPYIACRTVGFRGKPIAVCDTFKRIQEAVEL